MTALEIELEIERLYIGLAMAGLLAAQKTEPNKEWVADWALEMGRLLARRVQQTEPGKGDRK